MNKLLCTASLVFSMFTLPVIAGDNDYRGYGMSRIVLSGSDYADSLAHRASINAVQYALYDALSRSERNISDLWAVVMVLNLYPFEVQDSDLVYELGVIEGQTEHEPVLRMVASSVLTLRGGDIDKAWIKVNELKNNQEFKNAFNRYSVAMNTKGSGGVGELVESLKVVEAIGNITYTLYPQ
ncbi:hypothetical protein L5M38_23055 [Shewanella sp. SM101]|uniref:hypothetical protein n=1 Tax=Shewanella TaxID=22 RepID=UPI0002112E3B|nr:MULTISPECIES: hypothetical protein [Shewanella]AEH16242.1 hypothetical protein Sbal117_4604 [Shewanella baltica OS117]MCU8008965.1 hypothetical protein [Shewanella sp. SM87]MCU8107383.1 hypothetical protein [Shewanella sp. SM101]